MRDYEKKRERLLERVNPYRFLLPYQAVWALDKNRFKIWLASRQIGKSFGAAFEAVMDAAATGGDWVIASASEKQSKEFIRKVAEVARIVCDSIDVSEGYEEGVDSWGDSVKVQVETITLPNGARIFGLASNPHTLRGYSANVILDEFAFHEQQEEVWKAVFPIVSNPLRGKLKLRILSTPQGKNSKFYDLWTNGKNWTRHKTTIHDAKAKGFPINIKDLKETVDDADTWAQEYECEFLEGSAQFLSNDLVDSCVDEWCMLDPGVFETSHDPRYGGFDVGRRRDLSVDWTLRERIESIFFTEEVLVMEKMRYEEQQRLVGERIRIRRKTALDSTGMGDQTGETLAERWGDTTVEPCILTNQFKGMIFPLLKSMMQKGQLKIPEDQTIKKELTSIEKQVTQFGNIRYTAARTEDGHADRANALALASYATTLQGGIWTAERVSEMGGPEDTSVEEVEPMDCLV